jgi:H2-forming N5,N10-methylenetetrahydromethanopterin dehydrogenase-like enzyme
MEYRQDLVEKIVKEGLETVRLEKETYFYKQMLETFGKEQLEPAARKLWLERLPQEIEYVSKELLQIVGQVKQLYEGLSKHNLHPSTELYMQLGPVAQTSEWKFVSKRTLIMWAGTLVFLANACLMLYLLITAQKQK